GHDRRGRRPLRRHAGLASSRIPEASKPGRLRPVPPPAAGAFFLPEGVHRRVRFAVVTTNLQPWVQTLQKQGAAAVLTGAPARLPGDVRLLVRWGVRRGADPRSIPVLNRRQALQLLENGDSARRLELAGLGPASRLWALQQPGSRLLRVEVFDLRPLVVRWLVRDRDRWQVRS